MVEHQLELLRQADATELFVSVRPNQVMPPLPDDIRPVTDLGQQGPMAGIAAALAQLTTPHLLVLAVDLPSMPLALLQTLANLRSPGHGIIAQSPHGPEPLVGIYPRAILPELQATLATASTGLRRWLSQPRIAAQFTLVPFDDPAPFHNWNTPDQTFPPSQ